MNQLFKNYQFSEAEKKLFLEGYGIMRHSIDPMHDDQHVDKMVELFEQRDVQNSLAISDEEKMNTLLAITWHDTWKSQRLPQFTFAFFYQQMMEGIGSARLFAQNAVKEHVSPEKIAQVKYAIRKHSSYQLFQRQTNVSKILSDLDTLELFSVDRFERTLFVLKKRGLSFIAEWSLPHFLMMQRYMHQNAFHPNLFYHQWASKRFEPVKKDYFDFLEKLKENLRKTSIFPQMYKKVWATLGY